MPIQVILLLVDISAWVCLLYLIFQDNGYFFDMKSRTCHYVLIADLVASRKVPDRYALGVKIESTLAVMSGAGNRQKNKGWKKKPGKSKITVPESKKVNSLIINNSNGNGNGNGNTAIINNGDKYVYDGSDITWFAPLVTTRGIDEISGVLVSPERAFDAAVILNLSIWPQRFRFAFAVGAIDIGADKKITKSKVNASDMDGSAFHRAADALMRARKEKLFFTLAVPDKSAADSRVVEELADMHDLIMAQWTERIKEVVIAYRRLKNQTLVAEEMNISQQAVSDALQRGYAGKLFDIENVIRGWLSTIR